MSQSRQPKGIPVGGQFAANAHDEARPLIPGYTYSERTTDFSGNPFTHLSIGESRSAIRDTDHIGFSVRSFRFDADGTKVVTLTPQTGYDKWSDYDSRASYLAREEYMLASVERREDTSDWRTKTTRPLYVVTLSRSVLQDNGEYEHRTFEQDFVDPAGIPSRSDAIGAAVENAIEYERYEDERDYAERSPREYEDALADYDDLQERANSLKRFLGDDGYEQYVHGAAPAGIRYEFEESA